jgi:anti-sigma factor RsiW
VNTQVDDDRDLQAWVDGQLNPERRADFENAMAQDAEARDRIRSYRGINVGLRALYDPVLQEPVPARLLERPRGRAANGAVYAKAASLLLFGMAIGWLVHGVVPPTAGSGLPLPRQAAIAHAVYAPEVRHPVEVTANEEDHLVRWLSKRLGTDLKCPKLSPFGYELVGGRLLSGPNGPVAHFMFQDTRGARLMLYVSRQRNDSRETAFRFSQEDRVSVFYWIDGNYGYALTGEMDRKPLLTIANAVYKQMNP